MFNRIESNGIAGGGRLLARQLAHELTKDELRLIAGGGPEYDTVGKYGDRTVIVGPVGNSSSSTTCTGRTCGGDVDGGTDD